MRDIIRRQTTTRQKRSAGRFCIIWIQFEWRTFLAIMCVCLVVSILPCVCVCVCVRIWIMFLFWPFYQKFFFCSPPNVKIRRKRNVCIWSHWACQSGQPRGFFIFPKNFTNRQKNKNKRDMEFFLGYWSNFWFLFPFLSSPSPWMENNNNKPKWELCNSWIWQ